MVDCSVACLEHAEALAETDPGQALDSIVRCLSCPTASASTFLLAADLYDVMDDAASAARVLREATARYPTNASLWSALSRAEIAVGRPAAALDALGTASRLRPEDERLAAAHRGLVARYGSKADRTRTEVDALILEASGRFELGDVSGAKATLQAALERSRTMPDLRAKVRLRMGLVAMAQRKLDDARRALRTARAEAEDDATIAAADLALAELELAEGNYSAAEQAAEAATARRPGDPLGHVNLALARAHRGYPERALTALGAALSRGLAARLTRRELEGILVSAPWGAHRSRVDAMIADAWGPSSTTRSAD